MSQVPSTSTSSANFETIFIAALEAYKKHTKRDIASHPLAAQLQSCGSPSAILAVLRTQVQTFDRSQTADERWSRWLDPTVNVLYAFSVALGNGAGLIFPPSNAIFAGIGVLLQAVKDVRAGQNAVVDLFGRLEYFFKRLEKYIEVRPTVAMADIIVKIMVEVLSILGIVTKEIAQGRTKKYLKKLIGRKEVEDALQRLDALTQEEARMAAAEALAISRGIDDKLKDVNEKVGGVNEKVEGVDERVQVVDMKADDIGNKVRTVDSKVQSVDHKVGSVIQGVKDTGVAVQQVVNQVTDLNRNELRKDLRKWVTPPDPSVNYNTASGAHHEGTAAWCTKGNTLAEWKTSGSLLWIHGKPGSGKSILSSVIVRDIKSMSSASLAFLAYFYFDFKDTTKQDSRALLSSLLVQLSDQSDIFCDALSSLYSAHKRGSEQPTVDSLAQCLKDMLKTTGQVPIYLIMDALDESPNDLGIPSSREEVLELVKELVDLRYPDVHLCITSRPEFDIRTTLEPLATQQVSLHDERGQNQDINDYVTFVVRSDRRMKRWREDDKDAVVKNLTEKADGMFRWVFCQLEVLRHCFPTNLRRILEELPKSLDETYKRILKEINNANREHAYRLLQCLAVASRPLRVEELAELLAFDLSTGGIPKLVEDWRWEDQEEAVLSACSSLVSVIVDNGSRVVQFSHFSVKEFLISGRLASCMEEVSRFHIPIEPCHVILAQACLAVLLRLDDRTDTDSAENIPLFRYAAQYWDRHAEIGTVELQIKGAMDDFFDMSKPHFSAWVRIQDPFDLMMHSSPGPGQPRAVPPPAAPLYYAALKGFRGLVERLIMKHPHQVNQLGGLSGAPLHASTIGGHIDVAQLLFAYGADINLGSADNYTPLHMASQAGYLEIGKWLLDLGADMNSREKDGMTPLHFATSRPYLEVTRLLLERNAEVDFQDVRGATPLLSASRDGHHDVVRLLLDHNADARIRDYYGNTPLRSAASKGHLEVVRLLLERNAEVNSRDDLANSLLHASVTGNRDIVRLLLDHNADATVHDAYGNTPLHLAATYGHLEVARILLERNAKVNARDAEATTTFLNSILTCDVSRLLLDHAANEHVCENRDISLFHCAVCDGHFEAAQSLKRLLFERRAEANEPNSVSISWGYGNADENVRVNKGMTPLYYAAYYGHLEVAQLLLEHNAEINARDDDGYTPIFCASASNNPDILRLLLDHNADEHVRNNKRSTPLHYAAAAGHVEVAQLLLERNAEVNAQDDDGLTPFLRASRHGNLDVLQLLLDYNADEHVRGNSGSSPLHYAAAYGHLEVARLLLGRNAEVNARDHNGLTPFLKASERGQLDFVQLLLEHDADADVHDNMGKTPLHHAAASWRLEVAQLLLERNAEVNTRDDSGSTPFLCASANWAASTYILQLFLDHGADAHVRDNEGYTPLHYAAANGHVGVVRFLIELNAEVNARDDYGGTPILRASARELESPNSDYESDIVRLLLDHNASAHISDDKGATPLHYAAANGRFNVAQLLLERDVEVNARDNDGCTPFLDTSKNGNCDLVQLLLDHNADEHIRDNTGNTPLHNAALHDHVELVRIFLKRNAEVNAQDDEGATPLHHATQYEGPRRSPDVVRLLLDHGADVYLRDNNGNTPLHYAAAAGDLEAVRLLLERNAEVNARDDDGRTPFLDASESGNYDLVRLLLDHNTDEHVRDNMGNTPLHHAAFDGHVELVRILLERNVEANARDDEGSTPLHHATQPEGFRSGWWGGSPDVVRLLLDHGADACLRDNDGNTALHWAAYGGHLEVCRILLERSAEANSLNDEGSAPLHQASEGLKAGSADIVRLLLDHGADVYVRNVGGKTPSEVARGPEQQKIVELLSQHAAE